MFNIPFVFRGANTANGPLPSYGSAQAILWVDAGQYVYKDLGLTPAVYGEDAQQWNDLTVYRNNITGITSQTPLYSGITLSPSGSSANFPYLQFNEGNTDFLAAPNSPSLKTITSGFTLFFVMKRNTTGSWSSGPNPVIQYGNDWSPSLSDGFTVDGNSSPTTLDCSYYSPSSVKTTISIPWGSGGIANDKFFYYTVRLSADTSATTGTSIFTAYAGSTLKATATNTVGNTYVKTPTSALAKFAVASGFNSGTRIQTSQLDFTEIILYNGALTNTQLTDVWNYFKTKYGFTT